MRLTFQLRFYTHPGQSLWLTGEHAIFGDGDPSRAIPLAYLNHEFWTTTLVLPADELPDADLSYRYLLREPDGTLVEDWGRGRFINPARFTVEEVLVLDSWNSPAFYENAFYTEPFRTVLLRGNRTEVQSGTTLEPTHRFRVKTPLLARGQTVCLLGNDARLGQWNTGSPVLLRRAEGEDFFVVDLSLNGASFPIEYKYGVYDVANRHFIRYEDGPNRTLPERPEQLVILNDGFLRLPSPAWRGAGVSVPVFSLRSDKSFGIGEFNDLKLLADWCQLTGLKLIQILPINDSIATHTWLDSYPYAAISAYALHPIYLNLQDLAGPTNRNLLQSLEPQRAKLNALEAVDYEAVLSAKLDFIKKIYPSQKQELFQSNDFKAFLDDNQDWLVPYACYSFLRDKFGTPDFNRWPAHRQFDAAAMEELIKPTSKDRDSIALHYFIQYHLHLQLKRATDYLHSKGVVLKGDIAIGVHRFGADSWQRPDLFHMEMQAGAPPDAFGIKGQNWSFPTYNWQRMQEDGFAWWKRRFAQMGRYFDAFRIDHILGFFRIWSVPREAVEGILGYFVPALPVTIEELEQRGIDFDRSRLLEPWITDDSLASIFGPEMQAVKARFLIENGAGKYRLKPEVSTQRRIEEFFLQEAPDAASARLKEKLFDLVSNVILLEEPSSSGRHFHFRFGMESTTSFKALNANVQSQLRDLYLDYFYRRQEDFWRAEGMKKLPALKRATGMLVCGEDLGMVPACVPEVMRRLGLLSLEVQRMPKKLGQEFFRPKEAPYLSVITPATHDMSTIRGWWEEDQAVTQRFFNEELGLTGPAPKHCDAWINEMIIRQHLVSPSMWSIFQIQDLLGMSADLRRPDPAAERINVPANPRNYWRYRMHLTLETLGESRSFNSELKTLVESAGR